MKKIEKILNVFLLSSILLCYGMQDDPVISTEEELNKKIAAQFALANFEDSYDPLEDFSEPLDQSEIIVLLRKELNEVHKKLLEAQRKHLEWNKQKSPPKYRELRKTRSYEDGLVYKIFGNNSNT